MTARATWQRCALLVFVAGCRMNFDSRGDFDASMPADDDGGRRSDGTPSEAGFQPFTEENVPQTNQPIPPNAAGAWVTLVGRGGDGAIGEHRPNQGQNATGGRGGSGGASIGRVFVPVSAMGATYTTSLGSGSARYVMFQSGGIDLRAGWGNDGSTTGGVASAVGISAPLADGGAGGTPGLGIGDGQPGASVTNGAGGGGGGGGGGRSQNVAQGNGGAGGTSTGGAGTAGAAGAMGTHTGNQCDGGEGGGGGGAVLPTGRTGGAGLMRIEWQ